MTFMRKIILLAIVFSFNQTTLVSAGASYPQADEVLSTLTPGHPRLMLSDGELARLKELHERDQLLQRYVADVIKQADDCLQKPPLAYKKIGPRLLHVSRDCLNRIYALGLAYRWTEDEKYAQKAAENLLAVCDFNDWNPSHFLDTAEMSHAVAIGYDWLFNYLSEQTRGKIKAALIKKGLEPGLEAYQNHWWPKAEHNWNQVCNGSLIIACLAIAETDPNYAEKTISAAVSSLPLALKSYDPDGAWPEGPGYWHYATTYTAYALAALQTGLQNDFGLSKSVGLSQTGLFPIYTAGPTGLFFNFADSSEKSSRKPAPCMFWLAKTYGNPLFADSEHAVLSNANASPEHVIWYQPSSGGKPYPEMLDHYFRGLVEVVTFRSAWNDPDALFVGVKAGLNQVNHGHLDLGNFEFDALGCRWARDLGADNYNLPGYWDKKRAGERWSYYRLNSASHNVPMLNGQNQDEFAGAKFIKCQTNIPSPFAVVDLTNAYKNLAQKVLRGISMAEGRRALLVQDQFELTAACEISWGMTTDADINLKGQTATLTLDGQKLIAKILSPADAAFTSESAEQKPPQKTNEGVSRLVVKLQNAEGSVRIAVLLSPVFDDNSFVPHVDLKPGLGHPLRDLTQW
jgi:hypothetical protein